MNRDVWFFAGVGLVIGVATVAYQFGQKISSADAFETGFVQGQTEGIELAIQAYKNGGNTSASYVWTKQVNQKDLADAKRILAEIKATLPRPRTTEGE